MKQMEVSMARQLQERALRQLADYDACRPGMMFAEGVVLDVVQGYQLQTAVAQLRRDRGEQVIGYKVGCTSPDIRVQLGIDHCVSGRLYDSERHPSGSVLSRQKFANLAIEGELAVELSREPHPDDFSAGRIPLCVARIFPVIELHHHIMRGERQPAGELIANNAIHAGFVAGGGADPEQCRTEPSLLITAGDQLLGECAGECLIQTIHASLRWLTEMLLERGDRLGAGQIVLTGSIPKLIPVRDDCHIRVDAPPSGSVEVEFVS